MRTTYPILALIATLVVLCPKHTPQILTLEYTRTSGLLACVRTGVEFGS